MRRHLLIATPAREGSHAGLADRVLGFDRGVRPFALQTDVSAGTDARHGGNRLFHGTLTPLTPLKHFMWWVALWEVRHLFRVTKQIMNSMQALRKHTADARGILQGRAPEPEQDNEKRHGNTLLRLRMRVQA
jgi:hypothetical protein